MDFEGNNVSLFPAVDLKIKTGKHVVGNNAGENHERGRHPVTPGTDKSDEMYRS